MDGHLDVRAHETALESRPVVEGDLIDEGGGCEAQLKPLRPILALGVEELARVDQAILSREADAISQPALYSHIMG